MGTDKVAAKVVQRREVKDFDRKVSPFRRWVYPRFSALPTPYSAYVWFPCQGEPGRSLSLKTCSSAENVQLQILCRATNSAKGPRLCLC
eukprot:6104261-Amphidinium_carterae.1